MHESPISFRAPPDLVEALNSAAERSGVSQSELIRQALQDRFKREEPAPHTPFDPFGKLAAAARGDIEAQRALANMAVEKAMLGGEDFDPLTTLTEGLVFARLAAAQGDTGDQGLCISMLALMVQIGGEEACRDQAAEATARIALVADGEGEQAEFAARELPGVMSIMSADTVRAAKYYEQRLQGGEAA